MTKSKVKKIVEIAGNLESLNGKRRRDLVHIDNNLGARRYVQDAYKIIRQLKIGARILDLGCGAGQVSYLLAESGLKVTASEIFNTVPPYIEYYNSKLDNGQSKIEYISADVLKSESHPLSGRVFDAIVIYGVLEHVPNFALFLERCKCMLDTHGKLYLHQFPSSWSWREKIGDWMGNSSHELRFTPPELGMMLRWHGFQILDFGYEQILPLNLTTLPLNVSKVYYKLGPVLLFFDRFLRLIPFINRLSTSFWFECRKARVKS